MKKEKEMLIPKGCLPVRQAGIPTRVVSVLLLFAACIGQGLAQGGSEFLSVAGDKIVNEKGKEIKLKGIQLDFGSARGDVDFINDNDKEQREFFDKILDYVVTEDDFANIKSMGGNSVRLSLNTYKDFESEPYIYREENFKRLDNAVEWAKKHNIYLIISMRQSAGGHNTSPHSGNSGLNKLWSSDEYQKRLISLWKKITSRYSDEPIIVGYDLLNEPVAPNKESFNKVMEDVSNAIREIDKKHIIFIEGNEWGKKLDWINSPKDKNTAFSIHFYWPGSYAVKGEGIYPSQIQGQDFNKKALEKEIMERVNYAEKLNRPVWVGEFGAMSKAGNYLEYDKDVIDIFEELNLNWNYWNYKNLNGKSDTQAIYYMNPDNEAVQLLDKMSKGESFSSFTEEELNKALESLRTSNFSVKNELKSLLIEALTLTSVEEEGENIPKGFLLYQNYPNPFNPTTTIRFSLPQREQVTLKMFDALGREVATLVDGLHDAGKYSVVFDAKDFASGVYFYQLRASNFIQQKKMVVLR